MSDKILPEPGPGRDWRHDLAVGLALVGLILAVFWPVFSHDFVVIDDGGYVFRNPRVQEGLTGPGVAWAFTTFHASNWHPLTWLSHMLDMEMFGLSPAGHHLVNVVFHALNALLLFLVLKGMTGAFWKSSLVAALFAVHPLHVESVAWVAERKDVLSGFFWFLTMALYLGYVRKGGGVRYLLTLVSMALGLMAKPVLVTLPFALLLLDYWPLNRLGGGRPSPRLHHLLLEKIPFLALSAASSAATFLVQRQGGAVASVEGLALADPRANALVSYGRYLGKTVLPRNLAVIYPYPQEGLPLAKVAAAAVLLGLILYFSFRWRRSHPWFAVGFLWFAGTMVPMAGFVQVGTQALADRYTYIPMIGLFVIFAWWLEGLAARRQKRAPLAAGLAVAALVSLAIVARIQVRHWKNSETLLQHALEVTSGNWFAEYLLGLHYSWNGDDDKAVSRFSASIGIKPIFHLAQLDLGNSFYRLGRFDEALARYQQAGALKPGDVRPHYNTGLAWHRKNELGKAESYYRKALRINPAYSPARKSLGELLLFQGRSKEALPHFYETLRREPMNAAVHLQIAQALTLQGDRQGAARHYRQARQLNPRLQVP